VGEGMVQPIHVTYIEWEVWGGGEFRVHKGGRGSEAERAQNRLFHTTQVRIRFPKRRIITKAIDDYMGY